MSKKLKIMKTAMMFALANVAIMQTHAEFMEDSETTLNFRNFYFDRDFDNPLQKDTGSWSQGLGLKYESGYTNTPIQIGVDASLNYAFRLSTHHEHSPDTNLPFDITQGEQVNSYHKSAATLKLKYQNTELKIGELNPKTPVAYIDESRQLITNYLGAMLESSEIKDLKITAGRLTKLSGRNEDSYGDIGLATNTQYFSDGFNLFGLDYSPDGAMKYSYWFGQLEDVYRQNYVSASYATLIDKTKLKIDANYFHNNEDGEKKYGDIDSQAFGVMATVQHGAHLLSAGIQKNDGDTVFPTLSGYAPQHYLHAWSILPFIHPGQLTWHANYIYDFSDFGLNGLKTRFAYHQGNNIQRSGYQDNTEKEKIFSLMYKVPNGLFKNLSFEWRYVDIDTKYGVANNTPGVGYKENRVITTYSYRF